MLKLKSLMQSMGRFQGGVEIGEPTTGPESPHAAIIIGPSWRITETTLDGPIEEREITIRIYDRAFQEPREEHEFLIEELAAEVEEKIGTNYQLGGNNVRNVKPINMTVRFGWQEIGRLSGSGGQGIWYRTADIVVPIIVDDSYTFAAGP
jgi:hypothetical protein